MKTAIDTIFLQRQHNYVFFPLLKADLLRSYTRKSGSSGNIGSSQGRVYGSERVKQCFN